ncbi:MAG TPA: hypothetical protein VFJ95_09110, partial [Gammaproteobacteria bacterium]|nr:hypothetical protein [Gammaproteobacteria bacterium]
MRTSRAVLLGAAGGAIAGAAIMYLATGANRGARPSAPAAEVSATGARAAPEPIPANSDPTASTAERAAFYRRAADASRADLDAYLAEVRAAPPSPTRDFELGALLGRYAELDPARAVAVGRASQVPAATLAPAYA